MTAMNLDRARAWRGKKVNRDRGSTRRRVLVALLVAVATLQGWSGAGAGSVLAQDACQTPFLVYTDLANPGTRSQSGGVAVTRDSGLLGDYRGDGRFADYTIDGVQGAIVNTATGMARAQGEFVATSPDGGSSIAVWYTGQVDFGAGMATGNFVAGNGTGDDAGYRAAGRLAGTVVAPATLEGVDVGLC